MERLEAVAFRSTFQFTNQQLTKSLDYRKEAETNRQQALELIKFALKPDERTRLQQFWQVCPDSYFLRHKPKQLVWHALAYLKQRIMPLVLVSNEYARGATEIFIYCEDQAQLFLRIAQILSQKKVSIHDAQIITSQNGLVLDSFIVTELNGKPLEEMRCEQIKQSLEKVLNTSEPKVCNLERKPVKHQSFKRQTKVRFLADSQQNRTAFELFTLDREGLLARVSSVFNQLGLNLINAKITTIGERVEDFFVVTTQQHQALDDKAQKALKSALLDELSE
ncbi:PII uridylyl-transferase [Actinobacillus pleuropneumoniae]|nr:PII uridylyl-transferase [Actinobacillus pleuropneumoniae]